MKELLSQIRACTVCLSQLENGVRPVVAASKGSKIAIIGQAPGSVVHASGVPWDDKSGERLRSWMGVNKDQFYDPDLFAIVPMGFCYPGKGKTGDLPPRKECAPLWHQLLFDEMANLELVLLIGSYAQNYYLQDGKSFTLTQRVERFDSYLPKHFVLPHPSPRNNIWMAKNPWFEKHVLPGLKARIDGVISA